MPNLSFLSPRFWMPRARPLRVFKSQNRISWFLMLMTSPYRVVSSPGKCSWTMESKIGSDFITLKQQNPQQQCCAFQAVPLDNQSPRLSHIIVLWLNTHVFEHKPRPYEIASSRDFADIPRGYNSIHAYQCSLLWAGQPRNAKIRGGSTPGIDWEVQYYRTHPCSANSHIYGHVSTA